MADERRRRLDADEAWFCLHDDCLCCTWAHATEWELACHMRAEHDEPGPIPVPTTVVAAHLVPRLEYREAVRLARVDRWSRDAVLAAWDDAAPTWLERCLWASGHKDGEEFALVAWVGAPQRVVFARKRGRAWYWISLLLT